MTDTLSEVLRSVRLVGGVFLEADFTAPWCVTSRISPEDCKAFMDQPQQVIAYHYVIEGRLLVEIGDECSVEVKAGEVALLPRNDAHTLGSGAKLMPISADDLIRPGPAGGLAQISHGGGGTATRMVCGFLASEEGFNPLIASLPRVLKTGFGESASREWLEASVRYAAQQLAAGQLATSNAMSRLSELLLVEAVRNYAGELDEQAGGWLKGVRDPYVGRALAQIHGDLGRHWTAEELARHAGLSRSAFVERFTARIGMPPIRYLTYWRLQSASHQLRESSRNIAQTAYSVGYESEAAFSRAFKRQFGLSPAQWRLAQAG
jgi:AraC-like DNA-binding protein